MRHCCVFKPEDIYYLSETELYADRKLSIGTCPICKKFVAEFTATRFDDSKEIVRKSEYKAYDLVNKYKKDILYSMRECNYARFKSKPFGWRYGVNKVVKINGKERCRQYAVDFYGNKELVKVI